MNAVWILFGVVNSRLVPERLKFNEVTTRARGPGPRRCPYMNRPVEAGWFKLDFDSDLFGQLSIIVFFRFGRRNIADRLQQAMVIEPRNPFQRGQFDGCLGFPGAAPMNQFSLVQAIDGFR